MDKDSKGRRKLEDSGGGLLPAMGGHSLEWKRIKNNNGAGIARSIVYWARCSA